MVYQATCWKMGFEGIITTIGGVVMGDDEMGTRELTKEIERLRRQVSDLEKVIAAQKLIEEEVCKLTRAIEHSPSLVIITDHQGNIEYVNPRFTQVTGYPLEEVKGKNARLLESGETPSEEYQQMGETLASGQEWRGVFHNRRKDGDLYWVSASISPIFDGQEKITHFVGVEEDITERRRMEETLKQSEARYRGIFEGIQDAIFVESLTGEILDVNARACEMFGWNREQFLSMNMADLVPKGHLAVVANGEVDALLPEKPVEMVNRRASGEHFPVEIAARLQQISDETVMLVIVRDITERKRVERELEQSRLELERSNEELEQFASVVSHDLQEPLRVMSGFTNLLAKRYHGQLDAEADEYVGFIVDGAERMQRLIHDLLAFSRVGTRGKDFQWTECEIVLEQAAANLKIAIEESGAQITHDPLPKIKADRTQLEQLFQNLLGNAIKFHGDAKPVVHIRAESRDHEWLFSVSDRGIGIDPKDVDRIFGCFQKLHSRTEYPGTGLGLAICKKIVKRHGGRIWVKSESGKGSTFYFTVPKGE
jgi:PAS domain S-box-containing protein